MNDAPLRIVSPLQVSSSPVGVSHEQRIAQHSKRCVHHGISEVSVNDTRFALYRKGQYTQEPASQAAPALVYATSRLATRAEVTTSVVERRKMSHCPSASGIHCVSGGISPPARLIDSTLSVGILDGGYAKTMRRCFSDRSN